MLLLLALTAWADAPKILLDGAPFLAPHAVAFVDPKSPAALHVWVVDGPFTCDTLAASAGGRKLRQRALQLHFPDQVAGSITPGGQVFLPGYAPRAGRFVGSATLDDSPSIRGHHGSIQLALRGDEVAQGSVPYLLCSDLPAPAVVSGEFNDRAHTVRQAVDNTTAELPLTLPLPATWTALDANAWRAEDGLSTLRLQIARTTPDAEAAFRSATRDLPALVGVDGASAQRMAWDDGVGVITWRAQADGPTRLGVHVRVQRPGWPWQLRCDGVTTLATPAVLDAVVRACELATRR